MKNIEILNSAGQLLFSHECERNNIKKTIEAALKAGTHLIGASLRGANLSGANLSGADLRGANLDGANLAGAILKGEGDGKN